MTSRREFLAGAAACSATALMLPALARADLRFDPQSGAWRTFSITTRVDIPKSNRAAQVWVPLPSLHEDEWMVPSGDQWSGNAASADIVTDPKHGAKLLHAKFSADQTSAVLQIESRIKTQSRSAPFGARAPVATLSDAERQIYLEATELMPTDGIVKEVADKITAGSTTELNKARAIYEWIVENCHRDGAVRGCGTGDVASMLQSGNLGGKCADLNALYVALARASGLPARDVYGIRVAPSRFGYKSLGAGSETVTKSQHCRAEVYVSDYGWIAVDPADVRKVMLEEPPGNNAIDSPVVVAAREKLFGSWEGNWLAYNTAHDLVLPESAHKVAFLMYPQAEIDGELLDTLDPDAFKYTITAAEIAS
ncbi:transglutaminase-like putative cysteine protease [Mycoplana sp. BE70]|uniref:transglutaminase-like domain-containing protein n=1 Tax=Mycoplana sp. BE70 TaxID=2817775 RepID=UPI0028627C59|nr:transglutaminase domain-containing protein [Mycoplana sp. BE70]MDR6755788.1 transglutaminase-like putative cysteine protease [Mycoplana sp. BE70]